LTCLGLALLTRLALLPRLLLSWLLAALRLLTLLARLWLPLLTGLLPLRLLPLLPVGLPLSALLALVAGLAVYLIKTAIERALFHVHDFFELLFDVIEDGAQVEAVELLATLLAKLLKQISEALHPLIVRVPHPRCIRFRSACWRSPKFIRSSVRLSRMSSASSGGTSCVPSHIE